jgi:hypothetical protein
MKWFIINYFDDEVGNFMDIDHCKKKSDSAG